jgi:FKBP-type peptidyl-prolyl cis-trans isomerase
MCVGEKRKLLVPSESAYGKGGAGDTIPRIFIFITILTFVISGF